MKNTNVDLSPVMDAAAGLHEALIEDFDGLRLFVATERLTKMLGHVAEHADAAHDDDVMPALTCIELALDTIEEMAGLVGATTVQSDTDLESFMGTSLFSDASEFDAGLLVAGMAHRLSALRAELAQLV